MYCTECGEHIELRDGRWAHQVPDLRHIRDPYARGLMLGSWTWKTVHQAQPDPAEVPAIWRGYPQRVDYSQSTGELREAYREDDPR